MGVCMCVLPDDSPAELSSKLGCRGGRGGGKEDKDDEVEEGRG